MNNNQKREVSFDKEKLYEGVRKLALAVGSTLGPKGRPVLIEDIDTHPYITKDGVTVAKHLQLKDREENLGARLVAQAAQSTVQAAGDGTTTSTVLANAICKGEEDVDFIKGITAASEDVVKYLEDNKYDMTEEMIKNIAYISTNNDDVLSAFIADAFIQTGDDGIVDVQFDLNSQETSLTVKAGSFINAGYTHQHFINNVRQRTCELENPVILVCNATLTEVSQIEHILQEPVRDKRPIVIIGNFEKNFTETFTSNVSKGNIKGCLVDPGGVSNDQLRDLATLLGATYFDNASGNNLDYLSNNYWGTAVSATIGFGFTLFALESNEHVKGEIEDLKEMIKTADPAFIGDYKTRLSMLNGKYATIKVGAPTQAQALEVKDRLDDAVFAVGAAQKGGYLAGGGIALRDASKGVSRNEQPSPFGAGYNFLLEAIKSPYETILDNAGLPKGYDYDCCVGLDASNGKEVNVIEAGIIDPVYVTTQSLINATGAATALLSTKATLILAE